MFGLFLDFGHLLLVSPYIQSKFSIRFTLAQRPCSWLLSHPIHCHASLPQCHPAALLIDLPVLAFLTVCLSLYV